MTKNEATEEFFDTARTAGIPVQPADRDAIGHATEDTHYGFIMRDTLPLATSLIDNQSGTTLPIDRLPIALGISAGLLSASGEDYRGDQGYDLPSPDEWEAHEANVRAGDIVTLSPGFWTTPETSRQQVLRADEALGNATTQDQRLLAALNYGLYFNEKTMAGVATTLATTPDTIATATELESMPHLTVTNWAIGETVQHIYEHVITQPRGNLHVVDMCSGSGATLATITNRLSQTVGASRVGITSFEATPAFYDQLNDIYLPTAREQLGKLGMKWFITRPVGGFDPKPHAGRAVLAEGDVVEGVQSLDFSALTADDIVMGTVNYGFHRLPSNRKTQIIEKFAQTESSIIVMGDLRRNGSNVNRGYFNLTNNGPLNAGNIGLEENLQAGGYSTLTIGVNWFKPKFIDESLYERLKKELHNDGFFTIAYKGQKAEEALFAEPIADLSV